MKAVEAVEYEEVPGGFVEDGAPPPVPGGEEIPAAPGETVPAVGSLQAKVQAARARALQVTTKDIEIPGYDGTLWGTFRAVDDVKERGRIEKRWQRVRNEFQRGTDVAAELIRVACLDLFVPTDTFVAGEQKDGDRVSLNLTLGVELAEWLGPDVLPPAGKGQVTDHEAVFLIFPSTVAIVTVAEQLARFSTRVGDEADEEAQGE